MKWLLIYEFDVEIYRQAPTVRIFLEDVLLNEFTLEKRTFELIEFEYYAKDINKLTIEFLNDDNNYTNGFMTRYTSIIPIFLCVIPKYFLMNYTKIIQFHEKFFGKKNYYIYRKTGKSYINTSQFKQGIEYVKHYYKTRSDYPQNLADIRKPFFRQRKYGKTEKIQIFFYKKHKLLLTQEKTKGFLYHDYRDRKIFENLEKLLCNK